MRSAALYLPHHISHSPDWARSKLLQPFGTRHFLTPGAGVTQRSPAFQGSSILSQYNLDLNPTTAANSHVTLGANRGGFLNSTPWIVTSFNVAPFAGQNVTLTAYPLNYVGDNSLRHGCFWTP